MLFGCQNTKIATTTAKRKWIQRTNHPRQREEHDAPSTFDEQELRRHCSGVAGDFAADGLLYKVFYRRRRIERITTIIWGKSADLRRNSSAWCFLHVRVLLGKLKCFCFCITCKKQPSFCVSVCYRWLSETCEMGNDRVRPGVVAGVPRGEKQEGVERKRRLPWVTRGEW